MPIPEKKMPERPALKLPRITDTIVTAPIMKSKYIYVDVVTGHVNMSLPDDVGTHHYSIKFFDQQGRLITDAPRISTAKLIMDRRNFQKRGTIKFVLKKDGQELEDGYLVLRP